MADLDLTKKPPRSERVRAREVDRYSETWAEVVRPVTRAIMVLLAAVLLIPFLFVFVEDAAVQTAALDWSKTILAPTVGFASAAFGYYYGTRQGRRDADAAEDEPNADEETVDGDR